MITLATELTERMWTQLLQNVILAGIAACVAYLVWNDINNRWKPRP